MAPRLETRALTKRYPGVVALDGVAVELHRGRVHALVGENGAGKSTLIKILAGVEKADSGQVLQEGLPIGLDSPAQARGAGIAVVHQQPHLIPDLTVMENLALRQGYPRTAIGSIAWRSLEQAAVAACQALVPSLDVARPARSLDGAEQTLVELSFALAARPGMLILDEPTARLPRHEAEGLFDRVREAAAQGSAILLVTHRLDEVFAVADEVTVLRDGRRVWRKGIGETHNDDLIKAMVGRTVEFERDETSVPGTEVRLSTTALSDSGGGFSDVDLSVKRGEIYGIYGLVGAGQSALCRALFGLQGSRGAARLDDEPVTGASPRARVREGWGYVPADRHAQGVFPQMSVGENLGLTALSQQGSWSIIDADAERHANETQIRELHIKASGADQIVAHMSGGNQQKVLLGRWIRAAPRVLLLEEPTQGVDVGAKREIHRIITGLARQGVSVLLVSSELPELLALAHRIGVLRQGRLVAERDARAVSEEELLRLSLPESQAGNGEAAPGRRESRSGWRRLARGWGKRREASLTALIVIVGLALVFAVTVPNFGTWLNLRDVMLGNAILLVGALGMSAVIIAGGIDISVGAILGLAATAAGLADGAGWPAWAIAAAAVGVGAALGAGNGTLTVFGRVHSIVITLGALSIFRGAIIQLTGGRMLINLSPQVTWLRDAHVAGLPALLAISLAVVALMHVFLSHFPSGRKLYALGGDRTSAAYLGVSPRRLLPLAFALCGGLSGLAGLMWASRFGQVQSNVGQGFELAAIAAAVLGGTHIMGGRGSALGTFLGAMFLGMITNVLVLSGVSAFWERAIVGGMILLALAVDRVATLSPRGAR